MNRSILRSLTASALLALITCSTARTADAGNWRYTFTPYAWATDVGVGLELDGRQVVDTEISVSDLMEDLETIFQARFEARNGRFGGMVDAFDVTLADQVSGLAIPNTPATADLDSEMGMTIVDVAGLYNPRGNGFGITWLAGTRILNERADVDASIASPSGAVPQHYEMNDTMVDALLGIRFSMPIKRRFDMRMAADVSSGATDFTWSIGPSLSWAITSSGRYAIGAGYRHMQIDFEDHNGLETEMTLSGAVLGLRLAF